MQPATEKALNSLRYLTNDFLERTTSEVERLLALSETLYVRKDKGMPAAVSLGDSTLVEGVVSVPILVPLADAPALYLEAQPGERLDTLLLLQKIVVDIIERISHEACKITVIDPRMDSLPFLNKLGAPYVKIVNSEATIKQALRQIIQHNTRVYADCITAGFTRLTDYNATQEYAEAYNLVVVADLLQLQSQDTLDLLQSLLGRSKAGCHVIMAGTPPDADDPSRQRAQRTFVQQLYKDSELCTVFRAFEGRLDIPDSLTIHNALKTMPLEVDLGTLGARVAALKQLDAANKEADNFLSIPIGRQGARPFYLELGNGVEAFHALIGGRTGTGKSNLLNNMIIEIGKYHEADDIQLYLLDYKQGLEFAPFATHPNVALLLTDNKNIERGIGVLQDMRTEIDKRGMMFEQIGARNIESYREKSGKKMPRLIMIIDEFQVLFSGKFRGKANEHLKDIARRGRSFGLHLVLSSQSLKDYSLDTDLKNQLGLRIALRLEANECPGFLDIDNDGPTLLERYHAIINTKSGKLAGNNVIKINYLPDAELEQSIKILVAKDTHQIKKTFIARPDENEQIPEAMPQTEAPAAVKTSSTLTSKGRSEFDTLFDEVINRGKPTEEKKTGNKVFDDLMKDFNI